MKAAKWQQPDRPEAARQAFALSLADCLASPDPELRDAFGFEGLQAMLRGSMVTIPTLQALRVQLLAALSANDDAAGFRKPFSALALAEVARVDRITPFLSPQDRAQLVESAAAYLASVRDYRGFDDKEGWRHGVAHGADLLLQLSLNPQLTREQGDALLRAIASQVIPAAGHAYRYGEPDRLLAPVFYLARRGWWQDADWDSWLTALLGRLPQDAFKSQEGLAARHNLTAFLSAAYVTVRESGNAQVEAALLPGLQRALKALG